MLEIVLVALVIAYLLPGFVLLSRRSEGANLSGEAAMVTLLWPFFRSGGKRNDREET